MAPSGENVLHIPICSNCVVGATSQYFIFAVLVFLRRVRLVFKQFIEQVGKGYIVEASRN